MWKILGEGTPYPNGLKRVLAECVCGKVKLVCARQVNTRSLSCGCLYNKPRLTHGHTGTRTYKSWAAMRERCGNPNSVQFRYYGGRGIRICDRWNDFACFLEDMGERPEKTTLDRWPNKDGNYEPGNCRWATPQEQTSNRSNARLLTAYGLTQPVALWATQLGLAYKCLYGRIVRGDSEQKALRGWSPWAEPFSGAYEACRRT